MLRTDETAIRSHDPHVHISYEICCRTTFRNLKVYLCVIINEWMNERISQHIHHTVITFQTEKQWIIAVWRIYFSLVIFPSLASFDIRTPALNNTSSTRALISGSHDSQCDGRKEAVSRPGRRLGVRIKTLHPIETSLGDIDIYALSNCSIIMH